MNKATKNNNNIRENIEFSNIEVENKKKRIGERNKQIGRVRTVRSTRDVYGVRSGGACPPGVGDVGEYASYCARIHDEEIYHDLCAVKSAPTPAPVAHAAHSQQNNAFAVRRLIIIFFFWNLSIAFFYSISKCMCCQGGRCGDLQTILSRICK